MGGDEYHGTDFYCEIAIPRLESLDIVHEDDTVLAFHHTRPYWETHIVAVPKRHIASFTSLGPADSGDALALFAAVQHIAREVETTTGAACVETNVGEHQDSKHLHVHIHSGARLR